MTYAALILLSLATGLLWRTELELRWGWASLDWISGFHWAVPLGVAAFLAWMWRQLSETSARTRLFLLALATFLAMAAYVGGALTMSWAYGRFPLPNWHRFDLSWSPVILYAILGMAYFLPIWAFCHTSKSRLFIGGFCYALAFPIAMLLLAILGHKGGSNAVHAVKSGFVFPLIAFALGLPLIAGNQAPQTSSPDCST